MFTQADGTGANVAIAMNYQPQQPMMQMQSLQPVAHPSEQFQQPVGQPMYSPNQFNQPPMYDPNQQANNQPPMYDPNQQANMGIQQQPSMGMYGQPQPYSQPQQF